MGSVRRRRVLVGLAVAALALSAGCGGDEGTGTAATQARTTHVDAAKQARLMTVGKRAFAEHCQSCHGLLGKRRTTPVIEFEAPPLDDVKPNAAYVRERVMQGGIAMASFEGELTEQQIDGVVAYVVAVSGRNVDAAAADASDPDELARGEQVFAANCARCHGIAGEPRTGRSLYPGTDFTNVKPGERYVIDTALKGLEDIMPSFKKQLSMTELSAVAAYVTSVAGEEPDG